MPAKPAAAPVALGDPRPELSAADRAAFDRGRAAFFKTYDASNGLGPHFNDAACVNCHNQPTPGGSSDMAHRARIYFTPPDMVHAFERNTLPGYPPLVPPAGAVISERRPPALYGLGLLEAIPDEVLRAGCDPDDKNGDGVRGRSQPAFDKRPGRFGWKAHTSTLRDFVADAFAGEMGLTNAVQRDPDHMSDKDPVADPDISVADVDAAADFVRGLAPPAPLDLATVAAGQKLFAAIGCAACHRPETGPGVHAYTDLCLHDMGPGLSDGIQDMTAGPSDWRTAPLWGLRHRTKFLHDERAADLPAAIAAHGGEASGASGRFAALAPADQKTLLAFLRAL